MARPPCPRGVATSKPGKEAWAYEELWDITVEADPDGRVERTNYRGVFLIYANAASLAKTSLRATPAFLRFLLVSDTCLLAREAQAILQSSIILYCKIHARLRGSSKYLEKPLSRRKPQEEACTAFIEGVDEFVLLAVGEPLSCGYGCTLVIDRQLVNQK